MNLKELIAPIQRFVLSARFGLCLIVLLASINSGCSIRKMAVNKVGDALSGGGTVFASDNDPELIKAAVPFSLKLMESLLAESPGHEGLLFATASGFTQYAYAFVQQEADEMEDQDFEASQMMRARARKLYLRARDYGLRGLTVRHPGFSSQLRADAEKAVGQAQLKDVPLLYWTAISWAAAISVSKDDPELIGELPMAEALIDRAYALQPDYDHGAIETFLITYETARQGGEGDPYLRAKKHFERAVQLSGGQAAGPFVSYAESIAIPQKDPATFQSMLEQALAINPDARPEWRLANLIMQRRARWLLSKKDERFLLPPTQ
ncbi:MAG: TRAP transporter TatT component family protein [Verrucomicrobiota bacterium]